MHIVVRWSVTLFLATAGLGQPPSALIRSNSGLNGGSQKFAVKTLDGPVIFREGGWDAGSIHLDYVGRNRPSLPTGLTETPSRLNRFSAFQGSEGTQRDSYDTIEYTDLYSGVNLAYRLMGGSLKSEFELQPGAELTRISWRYKDSTALHIRLDGSLEATVPEGSVCESKLIAWQTIDDNRVPVQVAFEIRQNNTIGLAAGPYDKQLPLLIDPVLTFATTAGGAGTDTITGVARDAAGNIYVSGWTDSPTFSSTASAFPRGGGVDAFVMKVNGSSKSLVYLAYLGGSGDDRALGIAVDGDGYVYVCGSTTSADFPVISAHQTTLNGSTNAFLTKLDPTGRRILFSTYFGGSGNTIANALALDGNDNVYVTGQTDSTTLPTMSPFQAASGGALDGFVAKFNSAGMIQYASYLGGSGNDMGLGIAVDPGGNAYITGSTNSANFPLAAPFENRLNGNEDAFVAKVSASGSALVYSTYLGGSGGGIGQPEQANAIAVDSQGDAYLAGVTSSADFPVVNAYQAIFNGWNTDAFVAELNPAGSKLLFSTYLGGGDFDAANSIRIDGLGNIYLAGYTASVDFPTIQPVQAVEGGLYDAFVAKLGPGGSPLLFSTLLGGSQNDIAYSLSGTNEVIVGGSTSSSDRFQGVIGIDALEFGLQISPVAPFGVVDTPMNNSKGLSGAIAVTGWALGDDQVPTIGVWREPVGGEPQGSLVYLGNADVINGARPDVAADFPNYQFNTRAGWGFAVLTNMLPNPAGGSAPVGNGTYQFHAIATNLQGQATDIGSKTVTVDNQDSSLPFGTIDTPTQGQTISGTAYYNFGWALTPKPASIPVNGNTITIYIDGAAVAHPVYNNYRPDIATIFPGLNNSNGAVGFYVINSTQLANGLHSIAWSVTDTAGHTAGIGSRFFRVQN